MPDSLSRKYDRLYEKAGAILKRDNPCQIQHGPDGVVTCLDTRMRDARREHKTQRQLGQLCCFGCAHLGPQGCTVKSLICKVWLCGTAWEAHPQTGRALDRIRRDANTTGVPMGFYRTSKDVALRMVADR